MSSTSRSPARLAAGRARGRVRQCPPLSLRQRALLVPLLLSLLLPLPGPAAAAGPAPAQAQAQAQAPGAAGEPGRGEASGQSSPALAVEELPLPPHPLTAAELESEGLSCGSLPELVDYYLGPVTLSQDYLARDVVLLTPGRLVHVRVRAAAVHRLNALTVTLLSRPSSEGSVPRRLTPVRVVLPASLQRHAALVRLLGHGVSEQVDEVRLAEAKIGRELYSVELTYLVGDQQHRVQAVAAEPETAILDAMVGLFPRQGAL
ncbi:MAG: hypothetical protein FJ125_04855 [Deltaproteobacteria bacterium]|nr:hypothetical protein [Deltaproteobacteria bacterium]